MHIDPSLRIQRQKLQSVQTQRTVPQPAQRRGEGKIGALQFRKRRPGSSAPPRWLCFKGSGQVQLAPEVHAGVHVVEEDDGVDANTSWRQVSAHHVRGGRSRSPSRSRRRARPLRDRLPELALAMSSKRRSRRPSWSPRCRSLG
jgi:hypothetical protein